MPIIKECLTCGKIFRKSPSRIKYGRGKYCSSKCRNIGLSKRYRGRKSTYKYPKGPEHHNWRKRITKQCPICNKVFVTLNNKTCSVACGHKLFGLGARGENNPFARKHQPKEKTCLRCGKKFKRIAQTKGLGKFYCSNDCRVRASYQSLRQIAIADMLIDNGMKIELEKTWKWLKSPHSNQRLRVDIYLPELSVAIEYDGRHHREPAFSNTKEQFLKIIERDQHKEKILSYNNIPLIRLADWPVNIDSLQAKIKFLSAAQKC